MSPPPTARRKLITPFNVIAAFILGVGAVVAFLRFWKGLGATTNLTDTVPWGLWIGFDVMTGVALAAGGFTISSAVYLFGLKEYKAIVRPAILTAFLGYSLVVIGLLFDLGRPWRLPYPFTLQAGPTSALFEVALCVALYLGTLFVEFTPAAFEWLGWKRWRKLVVAMTALLTVFGLLLSTLHQSSLGGLYMVTPTKLHPLWYGTYLPVQFFVSAVAAGISMVIFEGMISHRAFRDQVDLSHEQFDRLTIGLAKAGAVVLAIYFGIKVMGISLDHEWHYLATPMGGWFLVELLGFVALPGFLFLIGFRERRPRLIRVAAFITVVGIVLNRLNVSIIAFNWQLPVEQRYFPHWMEIWITVSLITVLLVAFKWIANRMPIMYEHPDYKGMH
jgi:Ni/Fe-hydrogenase subunit HybB-like protein